MDKNTIIGMLLIMLMLLGYEMLVPKPPKPLPAKPKTEVKAAGTKAVVAPIDTLKAKATLGNLALAANGTEKTEILENEDVKIVFSSLGGKIKSVLLKKYKTYNQKDLVLIDANANQFKLEYPSATGNIDLSKLYFNISSKNDSSITFGLTNQTGQTFNQTYTLATSGYELGYALKTNGGNFLPNDKNLHITWEKGVRQNEFDIVENRKSSTVNYYDEAEDFDNLAETQTGNEETSLEKPAKWFSFKEKYFVSGLVAKDGLFKNVKVYAQNHETDSLNIKTLKAEFDYPIADINKNKANFTYYIGPNDYDVVSKVTTGFWRNVYLGYEIVKPINRFIFVPLFGFLERFFSNYGVLIAVLVLLIKFILTPLVYKSYISMAKMRVLQPELNAMKAKIGDDQAKIQQEQMKLYSQVGVSPMSGCVPMLLQMPILMSVFFLFPNMIELRQEPFLWANDLSTYDNILHWSVSLPVIGSHLSIFTLLMTVSSIAYAYYNNQITPDQPGPVNMKMMGYIMPVMFMFILNSLPAGLSFYYFISNLVTIGQQLIIRKFVDEDKIKILLEENRKKIALGGGPKKSKFSELMEKSMKAAEEAKKNQDEANKKNKKK